MTELYSHEFYLNELAGARQQMDWPKGILTKIERKKLHRRIVQLLHLTTNEGKAQDFINRMANTVHEWEAGYNSLACEYPAHQGHVWRKHYDALSPERWAVCTFRQWYETRQRKGLPVPPFKNPKDTP